MGASLVFKIIMNQLFIFSCLLLGALAQRPVLPAPQTPILDQKFDLAPDGAYRFGYVSADGNTREETSVPKNAGTEIESRAVTGSYSYISPEGTPVSVNYVADEDGFRATGNLINNGVSGVVPARVAPIAPAVVAPAASTVVAPAVAPAVIANRQRLVSPLPAYQRAYPSAYNGIYPTGYQGAISAYSGAYPGAYQYPGYVNPAYNPAYNYRSGLVRPAYQGAYQGAYSTPISAYNNIPGAYNGLYNPTVNPYYRQY